jgi:ATP-binding protein involved in chromosome partitioning
MGLREASDAGTPIVLSNPDDPAAQALYGGARGLIALTPVELPVMQAATPEPAAGPAPVGMSLPMA